MKNTGKVAGDDAVLLFATDLVRKVAPRYKLLKAFDKVNLTPGETKKVRFCVFRLWSLSLHLHVFFSLFFLPHFVFRFSFFSCLPFPFFVVRFSVFLFFFLRYFFFSCALVV